MHAGSICAFRLEAARRQIFPEFEQGQTNAKRDNHGGFLVALCLAQVCGATAGSPYSGRNEDPAAGQIAHNPKNNEQFQPINQWRSTNWNTSGSTATSPSPNLRGKTQIKEFDTFPKLEELPNWGFDGSSTQQAEGHSSDCVLKPVAVYPDATRKNGVLVMCEVMLPDGTPHPTNARATILDDPGQPGSASSRNTSSDKDGRPLGFPTEGYPAPQGQYYTGVGYKNVGDIAREIVDKHLDLCLDAGINHEGINAEVAKGQWEFQIFGKGSKTAADQMWVARYLLQRLCEKYGIDINWHCKPLRGDWNGSGMHSNFSTKYMREVGGKEYFEELMAAFDKYKNEHIAVYGPDNHLRLTGLHETQSIDKFNYGIANRGASIRVPHSFVNNGYKGYLEDRRPNSAGRPLQDRQPDPADDRHRADEVIGIPQQTRKSRRRPFFGEGGVFL